MSGVQIPSPRPLHGFSGAFPKSPQVASKTKPPCSKPTEADSPSLQWDGLWRLRRCTREHPSPQFTALQASKAQSAGGPQPTGSTPRLRSKILGIRPKSSSRSSSSRGGSPRRGRVYPHGSSGWLPPVEGSLWHWACNPWAWISSPGSSEA